MGIVNHGALLTMAQPLPGQLAGSKGHSVTRTTLAFAACWPPGQRPLVGRPAKRRVGFGPRPSDSHHPSLPRLPVEESEPPARPPSAGRVGGSASRPHPRSLRGPRCRAVNKPTPKESCPPSPPHAYLVATESVEPPSERVANRARTKGLAVVVALYLAAMAMLAKTAYSTPHNEAVAVRNGRPIRPNPNPVETIRGHGIAGYRDGYLTDAVMSQGLFITVLAIISVTFVLAWTWRGSEARRAAAETAS